MDSMVYFHLTDNRWEVQNDYIMLEATPVCGGLGSNLGKSGSSIYLYPYAMLVSPYNFIVIPSLRLVAANSVVKNFLPFKL